MNVKVYDRTLKIQKVLETIPELPAHVIVNVTDRQNRYLDLFQLLHNVNGIDYRDEKLIQPHPLFDLPGVLPSYPGPKEWVETDPLQYDLCVFGDLSEEFWQIFTDNNLDAKISDRIPYQALYTRERYLCTMDEPLTTTIIGLMDGYDAVKVNIKIDTTLDCALHIGGDCLPIGDAYCDIPAGTIITKELFPGYECQGEYTTNNPLINTRWEYCKFRFPTENKRYSLMWYRPELRTKIAQCGHNVRSEWFSDLKAPILVT